MAAPADSYDLAQDWLTKNPDKADTPEGREVQAYLRTRPDPVTRATDWLRQNADKADTDDYKTVEQWVAGQGQRVVRSSDVGSFLRGAAEGAVDLGVDVPLRAAGAVADKVLNPMQPLQGLLPAGSDTPGPLDVAGQLASQPAPDASDAVGRGLESLTGTQVDPDSFSHRAGRATGGGLAAMLGLGAAAPLVPGRVGQFLMAPQARVLQAAAARPLTAGSRLLAGEAAAGAGSVLGEDIGRAHGGEAGALVGSILGGAAPAALAGGATELAQRTLGSEASGDVYDAAVRRGVRPTVGLVAGEKTGSRYMENTTGLIPVIGGKTASVQARQTEALSDLLSDTAERTRPAGVRPAADQTEIGDEITGLASRLGTDLRRRFSAEEELLQGTIGADTPVPVREGLRTLDKLSRYATPEQRNVLAGERQALETMRRAGQESGSTAVDKTLHRTLQSQQTGLQAVKARVMGQATKAQESLKALRSTPGANPAAVADLEAQVQRLRITAADIDGTLQRVEEAIVDNLGVPYARIGPYRNEVGRATATRPGIPAGMQKQVYKALTEEMEGVADQAGVGQQFRELKREQAAARSKTAPLAEGGDLPYLDKVAGKTSGQAFEEIAVGGRKNWERLDVLHRAAMATDNPENMQAFAQIAGDIIQDMGKPLPGSVAGATDIPFSAATFTNNWNKLSDSSKQLLMGGDPEVVAALDDLALLSRAAKLRGSAANPSGTAASAINFGSMMGVGAGVATQSWIPLVLSIGGTKAYVEFVLSDLLAKSVAGRNAGLVERLRRQVTSTLARQTQQTDENAN